MRLGRLASGPASVGVCLWRVLGFQGPRRFDATLTQAGLWRAGRRCAAPEGGVARRKLCAGPAQRMVSTRITAAPNSSSQVLVPGQMARPAWAGTADAGSAAAMRWASAPVGKTR